MGYSQVAGCFLNTAVCLGSSYWNDPQNPTSVTGLMGGKPDDIQQHDWISNNGFYQTSEKAFDFCTDNFCVTDIQESKFHFPMLDKNFDDYNKCKEEFNAAQSCGDIENDVVYETEVAVCTTFKDQYAKCGGSVAECLTEGCYAGVEGIIDWVSSLCDIVDMTLPVGLIETTNNDEYAASGVKNEASSTNNVVTLGARMVPITDDDDDEFMGAPITDEPTAEPTVSPTHAPSPGGVSGDPHFKTWSGLKYDYHGICDLVLLNHPAFFGGLAMAIHIRSKKTKEWSYISTAVVQIGGETFEVAGTKDGDTHWLNTKKVNSDEWESDSVQISGFKIIFNQPHSNQREYWIDLGNSESIQIKTWKNMVRVDAAVDYGKDTFAGSLGLMGSYPKGIMLARDGVTAMVELENFGQEWQVLSSESKLFRMVDGPQQPQQCEIASKTEMRRRLSQSNVSRQAAELACSHSMNKSDEEFDLCVFDVMAMGDKSAAGAY